MRQQQGESKEAKEVFREYSIQECWKRGRKKIGGVSGKGQVGERSNKRQIEEHGGRKCNKMSM